MNTGNPCLGMGNKTPQYMNPAEPGSLIREIAPSYLPPAEAPNPILTVSDVTEPPLPSTLDVPAASPSGSQGVSPHPNGQTKISARLFLLSSAVVFSTPFML